MDLIDDLIARARRWAVEPGGADPVPEIEAALRACGGDHDRARLHAARASALQASDHVLAADDMLIAAECFRRVDRTADAAACTAGAATMVQMTGDWGRALELAVAATRQLADVELDDIQSLRAAAALCAFYGHLGAFDLAAPFGRRCVNAADRFPEVPKAALVFNPGVITVEAAHLSDDPASLLADIDTIAAQLGSEPSAAALGCSLEASAALIRGDVEAARAAVAAMHGAGPVAPVYEAWLAIVDAELALAETQPERALELLDDALPALEAASELNTLLRGLSLRSSARRAVGDYDGALADADRRSDLARDWQVDRTARYAALIASQAELQRDGSLLRRRAGELERAATQDPLTGLYSRRWLDRRLMELEGLDLSGAVLMIDLDHFKAVNDTHGHTVGDRVLAAVGAVLAGSMRDGDVVRYGGEEFLVAIQADLATAMTIAERARMAMAAALFDEIVPGLRLTISVGVAFGPMARVREIVDSADEALYTAKAAGRNRVVAADPVSSGER